MITALIDYFEDYAPLDLEEKDFLVSNIPVIKVKKNDFLLREGEISQSFYFVIKGCVRLFYLNDIEERTAFFYAENDFVSSYESFTKQVPSKHNFQALEDCVLAEITAQKSIEMLHFSRKFQQLAITMMEQELMVCQDIISNFVKLNAEQRYLELNRTKPELVQRIPQHYLATFLGVAPETLSRIRKRIVSK